MLLMKVQGRTAAQIAEHFGISPATARSDLSRAAKKAHSLEIQDAETYRFIQGSRLEQLLRAVWADAVDEGDLKAGEQARKYIADLTDLFGLKVPVRTEISGPDGGAIPFGGGDLAELSALISIADQDNVDVPAFDRDGEDDDGYEDPPEDDDEDEDDDSAA
jgi:hypothetical protein